LRIVSKELHHWRGIALDIPDRRIREDALDVHERKRTHVYGAALFWILPRRRSIPLLRLLVANELIWDTLDNLSERAAKAGQTDGYQLHLAITEAIDPTGPVSDYYRDHPWREDGGYLRDLVETCRAACAKLPSYPRVRELALQEAHHAQVLAINHDRDFERRDAMLEDWATRMFPDDRDAYWWELSGAASASLTIHALLALAAEPSCGEEEILSAHAVYFPWISAATTMLDSYVDQVEDLQNGDHSYIAHYPEVTMTNDLQRLVRRAAYQARSLPGGHKHAVIVAAMAAMYLSKPTARTPAMRATTRSLVNAGGSLTRLLLPTLRAWRIAYAQRTV
jgi:tetraprenyl-beta-curcumene synthase